MIRVKAEFQQTFGQQVDDIYLNDLKLNGHLEGKYRQQSEDIFSRLKEEHVKEILAACKRNDWGIDFMKLIFVGGSSVMLKPEISKVTREMGLADNVPLDVITEESNFINAKGFLKFLQMKQM